jgi:integrase
LRKGGCGLRARKARTTWLEPEQVGVFLEAAGRGRPLLETLILARLRISEALALQWKGVDLANGRLAVRQSKTDAGVRVVDLSPALREELTTPKATSRSSEPGDLVFCTSTGKATNRHNVRQRILLPTIKRANAMLAEATSAARR